MSRLVTTRQQLDTIRAEYKAPSTPETKSLKKAAHEFEALFTRMLFEAMDKTVQRDDTGIMGGGPHEKTFRDMMMQEVSKDLSSGPRAMVEGGLGIAKYVFEESMRNHPELMGGTGKNTKLSSGSPASLLQQLAKPTQGNNTRP
jgi:Rod binding domain-containing protein